MKRRVPKPLLDAVTALTSAIRAPGAFGSASALAAALQARSELTALFHRHQQSGAADPFLTEALASVTENPAEAARLYRLALEQCTGFPGEPMHSKRRGLIAALIELRETVEAREELAKAKLAAFAARDAGAVAELEALEKRNVV